MNVLEAMKERHSVRSYLDRPVEAEAAARLQEEIDAVNDESGLSIKLFLDEPEAFGAGRAHYGVFRNCRNYMAVTGPKGMDEEAGWFGERLVLLCQMLGLNTCWVGMTFGKGKAVKLAPGEKIYVLIALGYGSDQGKSHRNKVSSALSDVTNDSPVWYKRGIKAAMLAPTAMNQQKFRFERKDDVVTCRAGLGPFSKIDLGIVKYHFEVAAGKDNFRWGS